MSGWTLAQTIYAIAAVELAVVLLFAFLELRANPDSPEGRRKAFKYVVGSLLGAALVCAVVTFTDIGKIRLDW